MFADTRSVPHFHVKSTSAPCLHVAAAKHTQATSATISRPAASGELGGDGGGAGGGAGAAASAGAASEGATTLEAAASEMAALAEAAAPPPRLRAPARACGGGGQSVGELHDLT